MKLRFSFKKEHGLGRYDENGEVTICLSMIYRNCYWEWDRYVGDPKEEHKCFEEYIIDQTGFTLIHEFVHRILHSVIGLDTAIAYDRVADNRNLGKRIREEWESIRFKKYKSKSLMEVFK